MSGQGRQLGTGSAALLAMMAVIAGLGLATTSLAQNSPCPEEFFRDAELSDVFFLDPDRGWAVGDRGAIWHTKDGGRHWRLQASPSACRLESVRFLDDRTGWIVGGWTHPYTHKNSGVLLRTSDGGERWEEVPRLSLPALSRVRFFDPRNGWAVGSVSDLYPAGVFVTCDGGLSWSSIPSTGSTNWRSADFFDATSGIVTGGQGAVARVTVGGLEPAGPAQPELRGVHCVRCLPAASPAAFGADAGSRAGLRSVRVGWAVGDGGLAMLTVDGGKSWTAPAGPLPEAIRQFDCRAVAALDHACWIAGTPGSLVFHTPDGGHTWASFSTGQPLPIRALTFLDLNRGWAVGALGTILATRDGGRTWKIQQQGGSRAALLGIFADEQRIPLELFADLAGDEGYLSVVDVVTRPHPDPASASVTPRSERTHEAIVAVGGSQAETAWQFPLRHTGLRLSASAITADWQRWHGANGRDALEAYAVRQIRIWRPEVVITEPGSSRGDDPVGQMVSQAVLAAVEKAGEEAQFAEQIGAAGLTPWKVKKVYSSLGAEAAGSINLTSSQLAPRLGGSLVDHARRGWQLLRTRHQEPPQTYGFRLLVNRVPSDVGQRDFFSGAQAGAGGDCRRNMLKPPPGDVRSLSRIAQQRRNTQQLLQHLAKSSPAEAAWLSQVENLTRGLEPSAGSEVLFELAQSLLDAGRADLAATVYDLLVRQDPANPLCEASLVWLLQHQASGEAAWALQRERRKDAEVAQADAQVEDADEPAVRPTIFLSPEGHPVTADSETVATFKPVRAASSEDYARRAAFYGQLIQSSRPALFTAPEVRFPLTVAGRCLGNGREMESYFHFLANTRRDDAWTVCASSELWLKQPTRRPPKATLECRRASQRPHLDGRLDDETWQACLPASLASPDANDANWPAAVMLAYDGEFLFVAASCRKAPGANYPAAEPRRTRDPDLGDRDRLELLLDVDRDYATYYRLTIDHRGWAADACADVAAWNPDWYIAAAEDESSWTIEAALPWKELCERPPTDQTVWAVGLQRVIPGAGFQSWSQPADPAILPAGFGLLLFR
jgi:photosystem II stability/assembly factor-like uncharacterized protein